MGLLSTPEEEQSDVDRILYRLMHGTPPPITNALVHQFEAESLVRSWLHEGLLISRDTPAVSVCVLPDFSGLPAWKSAVVKLLLKLGFPLRKVYTTPPPLFLYWLPCTISRQPVFDDATLREALNVTSSAADEVLFRMLMVALTRHRNYLVTFAKSKAVIKVELPNNVTVLRTIYEEVR